MKTFLCVIVTVLFTVSSGLDDIIYPSRYANQELATMINCQTSESGRFEYNSESQLWGALGGKILLTADLHLQCLGDDRNGKYGAEALKYRLDITNLQLQEKGHRPSSETGTDKRYKRDAADFFKNSWQKVKNFFKRVFRGEGRQESPKSNSGPDVVEKPELEEAEEDFDSSALHALYSVPFQFVQFANGSIPEIRFAENEIDDERVKNFKRHLVDSFSTQLNPASQAARVLESSVLGEHSSSYNITAGVESASLLVAGWPRRRRQGDTVVVRKRVTERDLVRASSSAAPNDPRKLSLSLQQTQVFQEGRMVSSTGTSSISLLLHPESKSGRRKRSTDDDVTSYIQAESTFKIQLQQRQRRSMNLRSNTEDYENRNYISSSRIAQEESDNSEKLMMKSIQSMAGNATDLIQRLISQEMSSYDENIQQLFEIVERELSLKMDNEKKSVSQGIRNTLSTKMLLDLCSTYFSKCKDFLQLMAVVGGPRTEETLLFFLTHQSLSSIQKQLVASVLSDLRQPSISFLASLISLARDLKAKMEEIGTLCLSLGHLATSASPAQKNEISMFLSEELMKRAGSCSSDPVLINLLESLGNLGSADSIPYVVQVSEKCIDHSPVQIAIAHAFRHLNHLPAVQNWIRRTLEGSDCEVIKELIGSLMDKIQDQEKNPDLQEWPRVGFNDIDQRLLNDPCARDDFIWYMKHKAGKEAEDVLRGHYVGQHGYNTSRSARVRRRALWDDLNCQEWTEDEKYGPIQSKEDFALDRNMYNRRKSCLAFRRLGVKGAGAEIYAGMFAGLKEPSKPVQYKLFTKFVSGLDFLGQQTEIGSFYFYHHTGKTKAYVRILGRTRQELTHEGCTPTDLRYRPLHHIPLYELSVGPLRLSLGVHLSSQLDLDTRCPNAESYQLEPKTIVRVGGEAMATVLFARGSVNLGGNFNYKLQFTFTPNPKMCLKGNHGFDPMSISLEAYYQMWNVPKLRWGKIRYWSPSLLSWEMGQGDTRPWFEDVCIAQEDLPSPLSERETE